MKWQLGPVDLLAIPSNREIILFWGVMAVAVFGFFRSYFLPQLRVVSVLKDQQEALMLERDQLAKLLKIPQGVSAKLIQKHQPGKQQYIFGSEKEIRMAFEQWTRPSLLQGVRITGSKLSDVERQGHLVRMGVEINLEGSFVGLGKYIETLEKPPAPLAIENITITPQQKGASKIQSTIVGSVYGKIS